MSTTIKLPPLHLSGKFVYDHDVDILENNKKARALQTRIQRDIRANSEPKRRCSPVRVAPTARQVPNVKYNKWYIDPTMRYTAVTDNPKQNTPAYENLQYIYNNLHNKQFWNWSHPLQEKATGPVKVKAEQSVDRGRLNMRILNQFKKTVGESGKRIPLIVQELLTSRN